MKTEEIFKLYKKEICPSCVYYGDNSTEKCNITVNIDNEAHCINYKCSKFCRKAKRKIVFNSY